MVTEDTTDTTTANPTATAEQAATDQASAATENETEAGKSAEILPAKTLSQEDLNTALAMADALSEAVVGISLKPESYSFKAPGESIRGVFSGYMSITVTDKSSTTGYKELPAIVWIAEDKSQYFCASSDLVRDFQQLGVQPLTPVQITFTETVVTKSKNDVKKFKIEILTVAKKA